MSLLAFVCCCYFSSPGDFNLQPELRATTLKHAFSRSSVVSWATPVSLLAQIGTVWEDRNESYSLKSNIPVSVECYNHEALAQNQLHLVFTRMLRGRNHLSQWRRGSRAGQHSQRPGSQANSTNVMGLRILGGTRKSTRKNPKAWASNSGSLILGKSPTPSARHLSHL